MFCMVELLIGGLKQLRGSRRCIRIQNCESETGGDVQFAGGCLERCIGDGTSAAFRHVDCFVTPDVPPLRFS